MSEQVGNVDPQSVLREQIEKYRLAADNQIQIYTFSYDGRVQREVIVFNPKDPRELQDVYQEANYRGFDDDYNPITLDYDGLLDPGICAELANTFQAKLEETVGEEL